MTDAAAQANSTEIRVASPNSVASRFDGLGSIILKGTAIVTAMISVAVPLTEYIRGYTNQRISEAERTSKLASDFLDRIAAKDVSGPDRMLYFGALASLKGHPLQAWAKEERDKVAKELEEFRQVYAKSLPELEAASAAQSKLQMIQVQIGLALRVAERANSKSELDRQQVKLEELFKQRSEASAEFAQQQGKLSPQLALRYSNSGPWGIGSYLNLPSGTPGGGIGSYLNLPSGTPGGPPVFRGVVPDGADASNPTGRSERADNDSGEKARKSGNKD